MTIIKPFRDYESRCDNCDDVCTIRVWMGIDEYLPGPDMVELFRINEAVTTMLVEHDWADQAVHYAREVAPHACSHLMLWCENEKTFDLVVKLYENYHLMQTENDDGGTGEDSDEGGKLH